MEKMKADILRRAEETSGSEDEYNDEQGEARGKEVAYEDELDEDEPVRVRDGEDTDEETDEQQQEDGEVWFPRTTALVCWLTSNRPRQVLARLSKPS